MTTKVTNGNHRGGVNIYYDAWEQLCNLCIINLFAGMHNTSWEVIYSIYYLNIMYNTHTNKPPLLPVFTMSHYGRWAGSSICVTGAGVTMYALQQIWALHCCLSVIDSSSVQLVMPLRSQLMRSHQRRGAPPAGLPLPLGLQSLERLVGILRTWPNHWRHLCLSCSSTSTILVLSRMSVFWSWFHKVIPRMSGRQCI